MIGMRKVCFSGLLLLVFFFSSFASGGESYYYTYLDSIAYRPAKTDIKKGDITSCIFPPLDLGGSYDLQNIEAVRLSSDDIYGCSFDLPDTHTVGSSQWIRLRCYTYGIDTLCVTAVNEDHVKIILLEIALPENRNYHKITQGLTSALRDDPRFEGKDQKLIEISVEYKNNNTGKQRLILNDVQIYSKVEIRSRHITGMKGAIARKMHILSNNGNFKGISDNSRLKNISYLDKSDKLFFLKYPIRRRYVENAAKDNDGKVERKSLGEVNSLVRGILVNYFDKTEKKGGEDFLAEFDLVEKSSSGMDDYYRRLQDFMLKLNDSHVRLLNTGLKNLDQVRLPVYFYEIKGELVVCGLYDSLFFDKVNLGDKLIRINNKPAKDCVEAICDNISGSTYHNRKAKAVHKLLAFCYENFNETLVLTLRSVEGGSYTITLSEDEIFNNGRIKFDDNIRDNIERYNYKKFDDIAYLKIGRFEENALVPFFYSVMDSVMQSDGLVLDLRNNPGGDMSSAFLYSFFIDRPEVFFTSQDLYNEFETLVVNPDPYYYYDKPVAVIFNSTTSCSAELFLSALKHARDNAMLISTGKSAGSAQEVRYLDLPKTPSFNPRLAYRSSVFLDAENNNIDLLEGIMPDIWVNFESYLDLAPYHDKLLETGLGWLNYTKDDEKEKGRLHFALKDYILLLSLGLMALVVSVIRLNRKNNFNKLS